MKHILLFFIIFLSASGVQAKTLKFMEKADKKCIEISWNLKAEKYWVLLESSRMEENYVSTDDLALNTLEWQLRNNSQNTLITAKRKKNSIMISGLFKGKTIKREIKIDNNPWYQPMSLSLSKFAQSDKKQIIFWTLNPLDLSPYKIKALNYGKETIKVSGNSLETYKVKVILTGFRSLFWHAFYWFRQNDGTLVQYEGIDGPPTTPVTTITLISEKE